MSLRSKRALVPAAIAAVLIAVAGTGYAVAGTGTPGVFYGCVSTTTAIKPARVLFDVHAGSTVTCPAGSFAIHWSQTGPAGPQGPAGPPGPSDLTVSANTSLSNRDDSGGNGNWATDAFIRTISITRHEAAAVSNCGGSVASCWYYTGTITDSGTFTTDAGAFTPNQGADNGQKIAGTVSGNLTGGSHIEFYASSNSPNPSLVPSTVSGDSPSTGAWYEQFFAAGTSFSGAANLIDWSWTYTAPATCETWTDAASNSGGQSAGAGDITGVNHC